LPIALDEELIGIDTLKDKNELLKTIQPPFIILKPSLHGGIEGTKEWIELAEEKGIQWWITSALESNIGLNAICQLAAEYSTILPQGLGTGSLYTNNIESDLCVENGFIFKKKRTS
jgi:O-succinylbenzoate synthase